MEEQGKIKVTYTKEEVDGLLTDLQKEQEENKSLRGALDSLSAWEKERHDASLRVAKEILERDPKAIANIILNMSFDFHTHVNFCEIFDLRDKFKCNSPNCTTCIDNYLRDYYAFSSQKGD